MNTGSSELLITFLGRVPHNEKGSYRRTAYDFGDGSPPEPVAFFGWTLQRRLKPKRLLILGTAGSMWDHLFEGDLAHALGEQGATDRVTLMEAVQTQNVDQENLDVLAPAVGRHLRCTVELALIPYCRTEAEQTDLLRIMAERVGEGERLHIDVSHGFRHLPMLALVAALHLRIVRRARIEGIWYGSYDPDTGKAPVYHLDGLLRIADWLQALSSFDKDGDYGVFAPLLESSGVSEDVCETLSRAAYYENILNVGEATGQLRRVKAALQDEPSAQPEARLLWPQVLGRLEWIDEPKQYRKQRTLARQALARRDYLRAILYAYEAVITRLCQMQNVEINNFELREQARKSYERQHKQSWKDQEVCDYLLLKTLRNQVAHGTRGNKAEVQRALLDENHMRQTLDRILSAIEQGRLPVP